MKRRALILVAVLACVALVPVTAACAAELGRIDFPTSGSGGRPAGLPERRAPAAQLRVRRRERGVPRGAEGRPGLRDGVLGRGHDLQPPGVAADRARARAKAAGAGWRRRRRPVSPRRRPPRRRTGWRRSRRCTADGEKLARDRAYAERCAACTRSTRTTIEVTAFYALALLGTSHGGRDFAIYMSAAALVEQVYAKNPQHPGAAHYLIHSYDDPVHAPLGLRFADAYAKIAPSASHALHMPSHIYFALGMWDEAAAINERSMKAADERARGRASTSTSAASTPCSGSSTATPSRAATKTRGPCWRR